MTIREEITKKKVEVMQAWLDGKTIQVKSVASDEVWYDVEKEPTWDWLIREYRIKPKELSDIEKQIMEQLDILFSGSLEQIEIDKGELWFRYDGRTVWFEENRIMFYTGKLGLDLRLSYKELDAISSLYKIRKHPDFLSIVKNYIKSKGKVSIPVTEEESEYMKGIWIKDKKSNKPYFISITCIKWYARSSYYILNPDTKCWEDWNEEN